MLVRSCLLLALILAPAAARAGTVVVDPDGPLPAIQAGVDAAAAGDRVKVRAGVYAEEDGFQLFGDGLVVVGNRAARCGDDGFDLGEGSGIACLDDVTKRCGGEGFDHSATGTVLRGNAVGTE